MVPLYLNGWLPYWSGNCSLNFSLKGLKSGWLSNTSTLFSKAFNNILKSVIGTSKLEFCVILFFILIFKTSFIFRFLYSKIR